ncbi:MAG: ArsC/Spx/MgsR family protein [Myxococcota bacterium]
MAVAEEKGLEVTIVNYQKKAERPDRATLQQLVDALEDPVEDLVRKDAQFKKLGLDPDDYVGAPAAVVALLAEEPKLLQRPVLMRGGRAIIGRPRDRVGPFLS